MTATEEYEMLESVALVIAEHVGNGETHRAVIALRAAVRNDTKILRERVADLQSACIVRDANWMAAAFFWRSVQRKYEEIADSHADSCSNGRECSVCKYHYGVAGVIEANLDAFCDHFDIKLIDRVEE